MQELIRQFRFLVDLYQISPEKAKEIVDRACREMYNKKIMAEWNTWYKDNYGNIHTNRSPK